ncbi:MAG: restriction endonuclease subunit S [Bacteroidaceae bacterium]|nr:restriction endonuclease subunit S [Bacteroidaceae bacterium]
MKEDNMKQGWEIKKLGEVCEILDHLRVPITKKDRREGCYPYYGASGVQDYIDSYIFDGRYLLVGEDGAKWGPNDKSAYIIEGKSWVNNHAHILKINDCLSDKLVEYYLVAKDLQEFITGAIVPKLTQQALRNIPIPVPPLPVQEQIVSELDLLSGIIEKKREQLKELDALAQSIFYDMFGDPITNEKGWEVKKLGEVCDKIGDGLHGTPTYDENGEIAFINGNNLIDGKILITDRTLFVNELEAQRYRIDMNTNTILLSINGTLGRTAIYRNENIILGKSACYCNINDKFLTTKYVECLMNSLQFKMFLEDNSSKSTIKNVGLKVIRNYEIILPPLPLQHQFATKIEAIEKQKELIKQSISETETLFNARMQEHFG